MNEANPAPARPNTRLIEAANRAEATALLIRTGYRVYRPEADVEGEDLVVLEPESHELRGVQLKGRAQVDWRRYGGRRLWLLFPSTTFRPLIQRRWYLIPHDELFAWVKNRHGGAPKWNGSWSYPKLGEDLRKFLAIWEIRPPGEPAPAEPERVFPFSVS